MSDDTRQARIEAAYPILERWLPLGAVFDGPSFGGVPVGPESRWGKSVLKAFKDDIAAALDAADAIGRERVSNRVTANDLIVAYGKAAIAWSKDTGNQSLGDAMDAAKHRVIDALLTAASSSSRSGAAVEAAMAALFQGERGDDAQAGEE